MPNDQHAQPGGPRDPHRAGAASASSNDAAGAMTQAKESVQQLATDAKRQVAQQVRGGLDGGKHRAADTLGAVAQSLRASRDHLQQQDQAPLGRLADQAAGRVDQLAEYLESTDVRAIARRAEDFARREPALFLGGMFAVGLIGARFLKSSAQDEGSADAHGADVVRRGTTGMGASRYPGSDYRTGPRYTERDVTGTASAPGLAPHPAADAALGHVPDTDSTMHGAGTTPYPGGTGARSENLR